MSSFVDDIFSQSVECDAVNKLASSEHIVPDGFSSLDFIDWWKLKLSEEHYDMAMLMLVPINSYIYNLDIYYGKVIEKIIAVCSTHRYRHSDISLTFRYNIQHHDKYEHDLPAGSYLNWFTKQTAHMSEVEFIQLSIAFRRKEITFSRFLDFTLAICSAVYKSVISDTKLQLMREGKLKNVVNKVWVKHNFQDVARKMLDIKTCDIWNHTSVYETHRDAWERLSTHSYYKKEQQKYEMDGINEWFAKYTKRYSKAYED